MYRSLRLIVFVLFILTSCGNSKGGLEKEKSKDSSKSPVEDFSEIKRLCHVSGGEFYKTLEICLCPSDEFFNLKDFIGCTDFSSEHWGEDELSLLNLKNKNHSGEINTIGPVGVETLIKNTQIPNILLPNGNSYIRFYASSKSIAKIFDLNITSFYTNVLTSFLKGRTYIDFFDNVNYQNSYNILYYKDKKHLDQINSLSEIEFDHPLTNKIIEIIKDKPISEKISQYDKEGCSTYCMISKEYGEVKFDGIKYRSYLEREYILGQIMTNNFNLRTNEVKSPNYIIALDFANKPNLIFKINQLVIKKSRTFVNNEIIEVIDPFDWNILYLHEKKSEYLRAIENKTKKNSLIMCDAGITEKFFKEDQFRLNLGPNKESVLGWSEKINSSKDILAGVKVLNQNNIDHSQYHADFLIKEGEFENVIPLDYKTCFENFNNVKANLKRFESHIINVSMSFIKDVDECKKSNIYKTVKNNDDFLWVFSSGNKGETTTRKKSMSCPHNTIMSNKLVVASTSNPNLGYDWVDLVFPNSNSTSEAAIFTSNLLREMKEIRPDLSIMDLKRILILSSDLNRFYKNKVKAGAMINEHNALKLTKLYRKSLDHAELIYALKGDEFSCVFCFNSKKKALKKIKSEYNNMFKNYGDFL